MALSGTIPTVAPIAADDAACLVNLRGQGRLPKTLRHQVVLGRLLDRIETIINTLCAEVVRSQQSKRDLEEELASL